MPSVAVRISKEGAGKQWTRQRCGLMLASWLGWGLPDRRWQPVFDAWPGEIRLATTQAGRVDVVRGHLGYDFGSWLSALCIGWWTTQIWLFCVPTLVSATSFGTEPNRQGSGARHRLAHGDRA